MMTQTGGNDKSQLSIEGEMTIYRATELREVLGALLDDNQAIEIDLSRVTEMDGAGLQLMVALKLESISSNKQLSFVGHSEAVQEVLDTCDLVGFFGDPVVIH